LFVTLLSAIATPPLTYLSEGASGIPNHRQTVPWHTSCYAQEAKPEFVV
jgi:hypothetical protein